MMLWDNYIYTINKNKNFNNLCLKDVLNLIINCFLVKIS